jgi:type IV pilus assembly protein PilP
MKAFRVALLLCITLMFGACGVEAPKPTKVPMPAVGKKAITPAKTVPPSPVEVKVEAPPMETYTYDPKGKPDPFKPLVVEKPETPPSKPKQALEAFSEGATPLERMDLAQLKLVAIIWNISAPRGMVEDGTGKGYILSIGTPIGRNQGKITQITSRGVVVSERYEVSSGKFRTREVTLKLYAD